MKLNKIFSALFALVLAAGFTACTDEADYTAAQKTPGYYFPVANTTSYTLDAEGGAFEIVVGRIGYTAAESVTVTSSSSNFAVTAASFGADEDLTTVTVTYPANLEPGDYNFTLGFANGTQISQYGYSELNIKTNVPAPAVVEDWIDLGMCTYSDAFVFCGLFGDFGQPLTYKVQLLQKGDDLNHYRLVAPYGTAFAEACAAFDEPLAEDEYDSNNEYTIDFFAKDGTDPAATTKYLYIPPQNIGVDFGYGYQYVLNDAYYSMAIGEEPEDSQYAVLRDGVVTIPNKMSLNMFPDSDELTGLYYGNISFGNLKWIVFEGVVAGDYSADVEYTGQFNNATDGSTTAVATINFGADVASAKAAIIRSSSANGIIKALSDGTYTGAVDVDMSNPIVSFPMFAAGTHTIIVVTYDESGQAMDSGTATFDAAFYADDKAWNDLGYATVADGWIVPFFIDADNGETNIDYAYDVEMQESKSVAGLYRIKNMYGAGTPVGSINQATVSTDLYIDASDPECILVMPQYSGFTFAPALGDVYIANLEGRIIDAGYTKDYVLEEDEDGYNSVTTWIEDGMIIIDPSFLTGTGTMFGGKWYYLDTTYIILPEAEDTPAEIKATHKAIAKANINKKAFKSAFKINRKGESTGKASKKVSNKAKTNRAAISIAK